MTNLKTTKNICFLGIRGDSREFLGQAFCTYAALSFRAFRSLEWRNSSRLRDDFVLVLWWVPVDVAMTFGMFLLSIIAWWLIWWSKAESMMDISWLYFASMMMYDDSIMIANDHFMMCVWLLYVRWVREDGGIMVWGLDDEGILIVWLVHSGCGLYDGCTKIL